VLDVGEVDRGQEQASGVQAAEAVADQFVGQTVVLGGRLPRHAADEAD